MADILNIPKLGRLEIVEIYDYYDQPVLFSCKDTVGDLYLVVAVDENDQYETWLYAKVSVGRLNLIQSDRIDLHDAFANTEDGSVLQVKFPYDETLPLTELVKSNQIPEDMLPDPGEFLDIESNTLPVVSNPEEIAKSKNQEILDISLSFAEDSKTEVPISLLSKIFGRLQNVINTIGMTTYKSDRITKELKLKLQMSLLGVGAGSFNMRFASTEIDQLDLSGYSNCGKAIEVFLKLLKAGNNEKQLKEFLKPLKSGVAKNYTDFLKSLNGSVMNTKFKWVSPIPNKGGTVDLSSNQMQETIEVLEKHHEVNPPPFPITGKLTGIFLSSKRFEIETTDETYTGKITDEVIESVSTATLSQIYTAEIQEVTERSETTNEITKTQYLLLSLNNNKGETQ
ncbi:hypothetical protein J4G08_05940 [Candidatus Poribacteria bacterium]|nr:hypothetical protein [Candidatus Poribacteria bacterium]